MNKKISSDERFYRQKLYMKIRDLFRKSKYEALIRESTNYLELFPNDIQVRFMRAKVYRKLNRFEEAINDLKYNLKLELNTHSLITLFFTYYYLNMYENALELLPTLYETRCINAHSLSIAQLVMKKQLGNDVVVKKGARCDYTKEQILNYNEENALIHIKTHANFLDENKSSFNENVNIDYLFNLIRDNIKGSNKVNIEEILEIYFFPVSNVGYKDNVNCNFIKVIVIPNTNNIINMYPTNDVNYDYISNIEIDYDKLLKKDNKVKVMSRIDKFNKKYNM